MSKKTRKKSGNVSVRKARPAVSKAPAKRPAVKSAHSSAVKSSKNSKNRQAKASAGLSSKAARSKVSKSKAPKSKALKSKSPNKASKVAATKTNQKTAAQSALAEGTKAPSFQLLRDGGSEVSLADYAGRKLVVFFYPRADTPGCTKEAIDFTRLSAAFTAAGTAVIGVSGDALKAQESFRNKHQLSIPLASDEKHEMLEAYGAWGEKSMYGRTFQGILRTTVLIGADGKILKIWRRVKVDGHADDVLAAVQAA
jgi:thioredoxin-dependent peroxiredoxin